MDPNIIQLIKQLKEGHISQENLIDVLSFQDTSLTTPLPSQKENTIFSTISLNHPKQFFLSESQPTISHPKNIFSTYNEDKYNKYGIKPLIDISQYINGQLKPSNNSKPHEGTPYDDSNQALDTSAVIPDEVKPYLYEEYNSMSLLESDRKRKLLSRPTVKSMRPGSEANAERFIPSDTKRTYEKNYNASADNSLVLGINNDALTSIHGDRSPFRQSCGDIYENCPEIFSSLPMRHEARIPDMRTYDMRNHEIGPQEIRGHEMRGRESVIERNERWLAQRNRKIENQKNKKEEEEIRACTFQPEINKTSRVIPIPCSTTKRLSMNLRSATAERIRKNYKEQEENQFKKECTFRPSITPKPDYLKMVEKAQVHSYAQAQEQPNMTATFQSTVNQGFAPDVNGFAPGISENKADKYITTEERECKFVPQVNDITDTMSNVKKYLELNVVDRLYKKNDDIFNEIRKHKFVVDNADAFTENVKRENFKAANDPRLYTTSANNSFNPEQEIQDLAKLSFFERQEYYKQKKELDLMKIEDGVRPSFTPTITNLASNIKFNAAIHERSKGYLEMIEQKKQMIQSSQEADCSFQPQITQKGHRKPVKSFDQMCYEPIKKKLNEVANYRISQENLFKSQYTFTPQVSRDKSKEKIESRLGIDKTHKEYIENYNQKITMKNNLKLIIDANKAKKELEGCTFKPETTSIPAYLAKNHL